MTGYQQSQPHDVLVKLILDSFDTTKSIRFMQYSLRSGIDIFKKGGSLTQSLSEKNFNLAYDNRRSIIETNQYKTFFRTRPFNSLEQCQLARKISTLDKNKFSFLDHIKSDLINKTPFIKICIRMVIRALFQRNDILGLPITPKMNRIMCFNILQDLKVNVTLNYISQQKAKPFIPNSIPIVPDTTALINKLKEKFPDIKTDSFFRK